MELTHGGDWAGYRAEFGRDPLDFSANVSPLGLPEGVAKAITAALATADRYPDPFCRALREKLAAHEGVPAEQLLCGNGAADLIFRLVWAKRPRKALVTAPTFAEYAAALETVGCTVERYFLREADDFAVTVAFCDAIDDSVDMVFLCQPNNPTGQLTHPALVARILEKCTACGALLLLDECFLDFLPDHASLTAKPLLGSGNLLILKAFTKLYGMAGVRLGYALSADPALLDAMGAAGQPWGVSSLAQAAGLAALRKDPDFVGRGDMGEELVMHGAKGEVWGCEIVITNKVRDNARTREKNYFIVKPGALRLVNKQGALVEIQREPEFMRDNIFASLHCVPYLYDESKVVAITQFTGLAVLTGDAERLGFKTVAGDSGKTRVIVPESWAAPAGYRWVYALNTAAAEEGAYGTAYTGGTNHAGNDAQVAASGKTHCHLLLVDSDNKPVKTLTVAVHAGA